MNMNIMIAGSILNFIFNGLTGSSKPSIREGGSDNFDDLIRQSLQDVRGTNSVLKNRTQKTPEKGENGIGVYLKTINDGLAAKGKSSDKACLKINDIDILTDFLLQCGYTEADAKQFIGKLLEKHPDGMIPLSEFFSKVAAPEKSGGKQYLSVILDPSVTPQFDSILKDFGLTIEETDRALHASRAADGGVDMDKLIAQLKTVRDRMSGEKRVTYEDVMSAKVLTKLGELGIQPQPGQGAGRGSIPMDDLIKGIEQLKDRINERGHGIGNGFLKDHILPDTHATGSENDGGLPGKIIRAAHENTGEVKNGAGQLPLDVKSSIDRIVEKAVSGDEKLELQLAGSSTLQLKAASSTGKKKTGGSRHDDEGDHMMSPVKKNGKQAVNEGSRFIEAGRQEKPDRISDLNERSGYQKETNPETDRGGLKTAAAEILHDAEHPFVRFETISSVFRNRQTDNSFFPEHIIDQLGKQISKSVLRGDRIINLHLNPPELGAVKLSMEIKGNTLQLEIIAESSPVKEVLFANAHELKNALADQGIKLENLDIQVGQGFGRSLMNLTDGSGQARQQNQETKGGLFPDNDIQEDVLHGSRIMAGREYILNLKA